MKEQAKRVLGFSVKFWGLALLVLLAVITVKIIGAGGVDRYLKKTWSALELYGLVCLFIAECILLVMWLWLSRSSHSNTR